MWRSSGVIHFGWFRPQNHHSSMFLGLVLKIGGGMAMMEATWYHRGACIDAKQKLWRWRALQALWEKVGWFYPSWWGRGPIFRDVRVNSIGGDSTLAIRASNQTWFEVLQSLNRCSVGYQPSTTWLTSPRRLSLQVNWRTQTKKGKHTIWTCRCVWNKDQDRVQALITKELIATVVKNKNGPLIHSKSLCRHSYN